MNNYRKAIKNRIVSILQSASNSLGVNINKIFSNRARELENINFPCIIVNTKKETVKRIISDAPVREYEIELDLEIDCWVQKNGEFIDELDNLAGGVIDVLLRHDLDQFNPIEPQWGDLVYTNSEQTFYENGNKNLANNKINFIVTYQAKADLDLVNDFDEYFLDIQLNFEPEIQEENTPAEKTFKSQRKAIKDRLKQIFTLATGELGISSNNIFVNRSQEWIANQRLPCLGISTKQESVNSILADAPTRLYQMQIPLVIDCLIETSIELADSLDDKIDKIIQILLRHEMDQKNSIPVWGDLTYLGSEQVFEEDGNKVFGIGQIRFNIIYQAYAQSVEPNEIEAAFVEYTFGESGSESDLVIFPITDTFLKTEDGYLLLQENDSKIKLNA